jgi:hypothetical protein
MGNFYLTQRRKDAKNFSSFASLAALREKSGSFHDFGDDEKAVGLARGVAERVFV